MADEGIAKTRLSLEQTLVSLRHELHRHPRLSGQESDTADRIAAFLKQTSPKLVVRNLGGHGLAAVFEGQQKGGVTVLLRAELDALPLDDPPSLPHRSLTPGVAHKCGHDGHAASLCGVALMLAQQPLESGRVLLLFQPAEETGAGAKAVLDDPKLQDLWPDWAFAWHNVPGIPLGQVVTRSGTFAAASVGLIVRFLGRESHAGEPHLGRNPAGAISCLLNASLSLPSQLGGLHPGFLITPVGLQMGDGSFGTSPGQAEARFTLRALSNSGLTNLVNALETRAKSEASIWNLKVEFEHHDPFPATVNCAQATSLVGQGVSSLNFTHRQADNSFPWSEDFGEVLDRIPGAYFALGAGLEHPALHSEHYDFPDSLLLPGAKLMTEIARRAVVSNPRLSR